MPIFDDVRMIIAVSVGIAILLIMTLWIVYKRRKEDEDPFDGMEGEEFEKYCVELLSRQGFEEVCQTQSSHDYGIDIFADKDGISYAIQCKCYSTPIGIKAIQEAYAGRDFYDCMVGVVMTNQYFTKPAIEYATKLNILLWDADILSEMIQRYGGVGKTGGVIHYTYEDVKEEPARASDKKLRKELRREKTSGKKIMQQPAPQPMQQPAQQPMPQPAQQPMPQPVPQQMQQFVQDDFVYENINEVEEYEEDLLIEDIQPQNIQNQENGSEDNSKEVGKDPAVVRMRKNLARAIARQKVKKQKKNSEKEPF